MFNRIFPGIRLGSLVWCGAVVMIAGCDPTIHQQGWIPPSSGVWDQVKPGVTSQEQVLSILGTPTLVSTFDDNTWYYVSRTTQSYTSLSHPKLLNASSKMLTFQPSGVLAAVTTLDPAAIVEVAPDREVTPTRGYTPSILSQMFRNLGRFNTGRVPNP